MACEASQLHFLYRQIFVTPRAASPTTCGLEGQTGIVTGSNVGLGLEASRQLLGLGITKLILAVRSEEKGETAKQELATAFPSAIVEVWKLDMASYDSVQAFARRCAELDRLDFAILNAGVFHTTFTINESTNQEAVIQVNYLSTALLTILLAPILATQNSPGSPGRISIVSSEAAEWSKFNEKEYDPILPAFKNPELFDMMDRYSTSKLMEELFLVELVKYIPSSAVIINAVNPGFCYGSGLHRDASGIIGGVLSVMKRAIGRSSAVGARTLVDAAVVQGSNTHGKYLGDCRIKP